jgi:hypothetical protein
MFLTHCGGSSDSTPAPAPKFVKLPGKATDGPLRNALVRLATLKRGSLASTRSSTDTGTYTLSVDANLINGLDSDDLPYIYVESDADTKIEKDDGTVKNATTKVQFRSYVDRSSLTKVAKRALADKKTVEVNKTADKGLAKALTVSHFSNSAAILVDTKLMEAGVTKKPVTPESVVASDTTSNLMSMAEDQIKFVEAEIQKPGAMRERFLLLTALTKKAIEEDMQLTSEDTDDVTSHLLKIAANTTESTASLLTQTAQDNLGGALGQIKNDMLDEDIKDYLTLNSDGETTVTTDDFSSDADTTKVTANIKEDLSVITYNLLDTLFYSTKKSAILTFSDGTSTKTLEVSTTANANYTYVDFADNGATQFRIRLISSDSNAVTSAELVVINGADTKIPLHRMVVKEGTSVEASATSSYEMGLTPETTLPILLTEEITESVGSFYPVTVTYIKDGAEQKVEFYFGSLKMVNNEKLAMGIVGIKGSWFGNGKMHYLTQANIDGVKYPYTPGTAEEAATLLQNKTVAGLESAYTIAAELKDSENTEKALQGHLVYALTRLGRNLAHYEDATTLGALLDKLNFTETGRDIFEFTADFTKNLTTGKLTLGDLQGFKDVQSYFTASTSTAPLDAALVDGITSLDYIIAHKAASTDTDLSTVLTVDWFGESITFQRKDIYFLRGMFHAIRFVINFLSSHNFDPASDVIKAYIEEAKGNSAVTEIDTVKEMVETYSEKDAAKADNVTSLKLVHVAYLESLYNIAEPNRILDLRDGGQAYLNVAKAELIAALSDTMMFIQAVEPDAVNGGSDTSAFYIEAAELASVVMQKASYLSYYNDLSGSYHASVSVGGVTGADWYKEAVTASTATQGETVVVSLDSTMLPSKLANYNQQIVTMEQYRTGIQSIAMERINASYLFSGSLRDKAFGNMTIDSSSTEKSVEEYQMGTDGKTPKPNVQTLFPGIETNIVPEKDGLTAEPQRIMVFKGAAKNEKFVADYSGLSSLLSSIDAVYVKYDHEFVDQIAVPTSATTMSYTNVSPFPIITAGSYGTTRIVIQKRNATTKAPSYCTGYFYDATGNYKTEYDATYAVDFSHCSGVPAWSAEVPSFVNRLRYLEGKAIIESETIEDPGTDPGTGNGLSFSASDVESKKFQVIWVNDVNTTAGQALNSTFFRSGLAFANEKVEDWYTGDTYEFSNASTGTLTWVVKTDGVLAYRTSNTANEINDATMLERGTGYFKVKRIFYNDTTGEVPNNDNAFYEYWFEYSDTDSEFTASDYEGVVFRAEEADGTANFTPANPKSGYATIDCSNASAGSGTCRYSDGTDSGTYNVSLNSGRLSLVSTTDQNETVSIQLLQREDSYFQVYINTVTSTSSDLTVEYWYPQN